MFFGNFDWFNIFQLFKLLIKISITALIQDYIWNCYAIPISILYEFDKMWVTKQNINVTRVLTNSYKMLQARAIPKTDPESER